MRALKLSDTSRQDGVPARFLAALLDSAPDGVLVIAEPGLVRYANPSAGRLLGRMPDELIGRPIASLLSRSEFVDPLLASLEGEREIELRNGRSRDVLASWVPLCIEGETTTSRVVFLHDQTERRRAESKLERTNAELEHCVHTLAHDLRSPLVALLGFSRLLRQDYGSRLDDTALHFVDRIEQAGETMEALIRNLLELSRVGENGSCRTWVDPRSVLLQLAAELKPRIDAAGIQLELPENPPLVYCDRTRLYQVFCNLIGNAIDHMGPCSQPAIRVHVTEQSSGHVLSVEDTGRGIAPEYHDRIFEVFQSLSPRAGGRRGSGIGLAIVKKIAESHGGRVWVESTPGRGTSFRVHLPRP